MSQSTTIFFSDSFFSSISFHGKSLDAIAKIMSSRTFSVPSPPFRGSDLEGAHKVAFSGPANGFSPGWQLLLWAYPGVKAVVSHSALEQSSYSLHLNPALGVSGYLSGAGLSAVSLEANPPYVHTVPGPGTVRYAWTLPASYSARDEYEDGIAALSLYSVPSVSYCGDLVHFRLPVKSSTDSIPFLVTRREFNNLVTDGRAGLLSPLRIRWPDFAPTTTAIRVEHTEAAIIRPDWEQVVSDVGWGRMYGFKFSGRAKTSVQLKVPVEVPPNLPVHVSCLATGHTFWVQWHDGRLVVPVGAFGCVVVCRSFTARVSAEPEHVVSRLIRGRLPEDHKALARLGDLHVNFLQSVFGTLPDCWWGPPPPIVNPGVRAPALGTILKGSIYHEGNVFCSTVPVPRDTFVMVRCGTRDVVLRCAVPSMVFLKYPNPNLYAGVVVHTPLHEFACEDVLTQNRQSVGERSIHRQGSMLVVQGRTDISWDPSWYPYLQRRPDPPRSNPDVDRSMKLLESLPRQPPGPTWSDATGYYCSVASFKPQGPPPLALHQRASSIDDPDGWTLTRPTRRSPSGDIVEMVPIPGFLSLSLDIVQCFWREGDELYPISYPLGPVWYEHGDVLGHTVVLQAYGDGNYRKVDGFFHQSHVHADLSNDPWHAFRLNHGIHLAEVDNLPPASEALRFSHTWMSFDDRALNPNHMELSFEPSAPAAMDTDTDGDVTDDDDDDFDVVLAD